MTSNVCQNCNSIIGLAGLNGEHTCSCSCWIYDHVSDKMDFHCSIPDASLDKNLCNKFGVPYCVDILRAIEDRKIHGCVIINQEGAPA